MKRKNKVNIFAGLSITEKAMVFLSFSAGFISFFTNTTINPALPVITQEFNVEGFLSSWLVSAYLIGMTATIPYNSYFLEKFKLKILFFGSMLVYIFACLLISFGNNILILLLARFIQGLCAGIFVPTNKACLLHVFSKDKWGRALSLYSFTIGIAPLLGPTYSGLFCDLFGWRWTYISICVICGIICVLGLCFMPFKRINSNKKTRFDVVTFICSFFGLTFILLATTLIADGSFAPSDTIILILGIVLYVTFVVRQIKMKNPIVKFSLLKIRRFRVGIIACMVGNFTSSATVVLMPFVVQTCLGYSATVSGLVSLPAALLLNFIFPINGYLYDKYGLHFKGIIGLGILTITGLLFSGLDQSTAILFIVVCLCFRNIGFALCANSINSWSLKSLKEEDVLQGNALFTYFNQMVRPFATTLSTTIWSVVAILYVNTMSEIEASLLGINASFIMQSIFCFIALIIMLKYMIYCKKNGINFG